jgi:4-nitrophenyl phosphatase
VGKMNIDILKQKKCYVLDMDGTFYLGNLLIDGSLDFLEQLKKLGKDFVFFTNNTSRSAQFYLDKLAKMGCSIAPEKLITASMVSRKFILKEYGHPRIYLLGTPSLKSDFFESGFDLVEKEPDIVVVGFDTTLTYEKLNIACAFIRRGKPFIATHPDLNCPTENGYMPDCGAICAFITASTGVNARILGKPFPETLDFILDCTGYKKEELAFTGDRLYTDIAIGANNGVTSILVLTGEARLDNLKNSRVQPDFVFNRLSDMIRLL